MAGKFLLLDGKNVASLLSMTECVNVMRHALKSLSSADGKTVNPLRQQLWLPSKLGGLISMPACYCVSDESGADSTYTGMKALSIFPHNVDAPSHLGLVLLFEGNQGQLLSMMDATEITGIRTAAASAVATEILAKADSKKLAILGTGHQAHTHLQSMLVARPSISEVSIFGRRVEKANEFAETSRSSFPHLQFSVHEQPRECIRGADIICLVTNSPTPIVLGEWLEEGQHVNAVGACTPVTRELDTEAILRSRFFGDSRIATENESGEYIIPLKEGSIQKSHLLGEIGEILNGTLEGRTSDRDITVFKSLGVAVEDIASAVFIFNKAKKSDVGRWIEWN